MKGLIRATVILLLVWAVTVSCAATRPSSNPFANARFGLQIAHENNHTQSYNTDQGSDIVIDCGKCDDPCRVHLRADGSVSVRRGRLDREAVRLLVGFIDWEN